MNERQLLLHILHSAMAETEIGTARAAGIINWYQNNAGFLGLAKTLRKLEKAQAKCRASKKKRPKNKRRTDRWSLLKTTLSDALAAGPKRQNEKPAAILLIAEHLAAMLELTAEETRLLQIVVAINRLRRTASLYWLLRSHGIDSATFAAKLAGFETIEILRKSPVVQLGLVEISANRSGEITIILCDTVNRVLDRAPVSDEDLLACLVGRHAPANLGLADFPEVLGPSDLLRRLLAGAMEQREKGVNILLYGPPGTGKTELAKTLAEASGARLYAVGETDDYGDEPTRWERVTALTLAQKVLAGRSDTLLLFDEMEDLIGEAQRLQNGTFSQRSGSKVFVNRLFENNPVPTLWTTNDIENIDTAFLRRMSYVLKMELPRPAARKRILTRILTDEGLPLADSEIQRLAAATPEITTVARKAIRAASLASGSGNEVEQALDALVTGIRYGHPKAPATAASSPLDLSLYRADLDIEALFARMTAKDVPRDFSLLLTGPPGTGKTALAHHLARALDQPLVIKRASDLLSKWIGDSEKQIAAAFAEAAQTGSILLLDEIDSLLFDRSSASRSWEVSQVNELLTWMESHPQPFIAATNHADKLDPAAMRRFVFKVRLKPLTAGQAARAFQIFFGLEPPAHLSAIEGLTPGDFAVVARQRRFHSAPLTAEEIAGLLSAEINAKAPPRRPIGFRPAKQAQAGASAITGFAARPGSGN